MDAGFVQLQAQGPADVVDGQRKAVEHKIAQAVKNRLAFVALGVLQLVRVAADDGVGARVDHQAGELALAVVGHRLFPAPVHDRDHHIGFVNSARGADIAHHLRVLAPGDAGPVGVGLEAARLKLVVAQHRHAHAFALDDPGGVRLGQVHAAAVIAQAALLEQAQHLGKRLGAEVARVVVGQADGVKVALEVLQGAGVDAKHIRLVVLGAADGGHHALQVANADVGARKQTGKTGVGVAAFAHGVHGAVFEHHVADDDHGQRAIGRRLAHRRRLGGRLIGRKTGRGQPEREHSQRERGKKCARLHGATSAKAHWYCSSLPKSGE